MLLGLVGRRGSLLNPHLSPKSANRLAFRTFENQWEHCLENVLPIGKTAFLAGEVWEAHFDNRLTSFVSRRLFGNPLFQG